MPAPPDPFCTLFHRDAGFSALAEAELRALGGGQGVEPGVWLSPVPIRWARCGYGSAGGRQLAFAPTLEELEVQLRARALRADRFSVSILRIPQRRKGATEAKVRVAACIEGVESAEDPQLRLVVLVSPLGFRVFEESPAEPGEADWLGVAHKPHNYVVGLPVRIAQAMLHLTIRPGDTLFDPFCGSGTLPILASWAGHRAFGSDVSGVCIMKARANAAHFGREVTLRCCDARATTQEADGIVANLPYGLYSHFAADGLRATLKNLGRLAPRATFVTSDHLTDDLHAEGYVLEQVIAVESNRFERFVYVTRTPKGA